MSEAQTRKIDHALIIGGCGGFGRRFAASLREQGIKVTTVDTAQDADIVADVATHPEALSAALLSTQLVWLCLPEASAVAVLKALHLLVPADVLVVDICSVKTPVCKVAAQHCTQAEYVSLHPMFGPERDYQGNSAVFIPLRSGPLAQALRDLLQIWGLKVIDTDVDTHDRITSLVQVIPHALLISFAHMRSVMDVDDALVDAFATPIYRDLDQVSQGLVNENPALYHNIQNANPHGDAARKALLDALQSTLDTLTENEVEATRALFAKARRDA